MLCPSRSSTEDWPWLKPLLSKVLPSKLDWFPSTIEAFWEEKWALMDFQCALESNVKVHNWSSFAIY